MRYTLSVYWKNGRAADYYFKENTSVYSWLNKYAVDILRVEYHKYGA